MSYTVNELSEIGRTKFNLSEEWCCFSAEVGEDGRLRYGLSPKDKDGKWMDEEFYGYVSLDDDKGMSEC